jgi:hypothetical protein
MKKLYMGVLIGIVSGSISAQGFAWAKKGGLWAYDYGYGITTDNSGNVYVAGKYEQNANFSGTILGCKGNHDIFVAQYSPSGNLNWIRTAGGYTGDYATSVACDGNYVYVAGEIEGQNATITFQGSSITLQCQGSNDIFLAKYSLTGNLLWAKRAGGSNYEKALGITYDQSGNVYICGLYTGYATFGGNTTISGYGDRDIFIAKYDANGNFLWVRKAGSSKRDEAKGIACDAGGNVYITGMYKDGCAFGSQYLGSPNGYWNLFIAKYSPSGSLMWVKKGGGNYDDVGWGIAIDKAAGRIYVGGEFNATATFSGHTVYTGGSADVLALCYDLNGNIQWAKKAGGNGADRARGIGFNSGRVFITGQFSGTASFGPFTKSASDNSDIFIACLDHTGTFRWAIDADGAADAPEDLGYESGNAVCAFNINTVYATGSMLNGAVFGSTSLSAYSRTDVFVTRVNAPSSDKLAADSSANEIPEEEVITPTFSDTAPPVNVRSLSDEEFLNGVNVYPNPGDGHVILELQLPGEDAVEMKVLNSLGQVIVENRLAPSSKTHVDLTGLNKGVYFIDLYLGESAIRKKVIVQ